MFLLYVFKLGSYNTNNIIQMIEQNSTDNMKLLSEDIHLMHKTVLEYKTKIIQVETNYYSIP